MLGQSRAVRVLHHVLGVRTTLGALGLHHGRCELHMGTVLGAGVLLVVEGLAHCALVDGQLRPHLTRSCC